MTKPNTRPRIKPKINAYHFVLGARDASEGIPRTAGALVSDAMRPSWLAGYDTHKRIITQ